MDDVELLVSVLRLEGREEPSSPAGHGADVVDVCTEEWPVGGVRLLGVREDVHVVVAREALDEPEDGGDDAIGAGAIDATVDEQGELHPAKTVARTSLPIFKSTLALSVA